MNSETPLSIKLKMLEDAGFPMDDIHEKYVLLIDYIKKYCTDIDPYTWHNDISGWHRESIVEGQKLLKYFEEI